MDEEDVPAALPTFEERLIPPSLDNRSKDTRQSLEKQVFDDSAALLKLFALPATLQNSLPLNEALAIARKFNRLLLAVVFATDDFQAWKLNRDVWASETVQLLINEHFCFWQRTTEDKEGAEFIKLYHSNYDSNDRSNDRSTVVICVLDSRTGRVMQKWQGVKRFCDDSTAASELLDFLESRQATAFRASAGEPVPLPSEGAKKPSKIFESFVEGSSSEYVPLARPKLPDRSTRQTPVVRSSDENCEDDEVEELEDEIYFDEDDAEPSPKRRALSPPEETHSSDSESVSSDSSSEGEANPAKKSEIAAPVADYSEANRVLKSLHAARLRRQALS